MKGGREITRSLGKRCKDYVWDIYTRMFTTNKNSFASSFYVKFYLFLYCYKFT